MASFSLERVEPWVPMGTAGHAYSFGCMATIAYMDAWGMWVHGCHGRANRACASPHTRRDESYRIAPVRVVQILTECKKTIPKKQAFSPCANHRIGPKTILVSAVADTHTQRKVTHHG